LVHVFIPHRQKEEETEMFKTFCKALIPALVAVVVLPAVAAEGRTPIYAWQTTITAPGKYIVTRDIFPLICTAAPIEIQVPAAPPIPAGHVDIDLNGFRVAACPGHPVIHAVGQDNITIRNGTLMFGDYGVFIEADPAEPAARNRKVVIEDVKVMDVLIAGIQLNGITDFALRRNNVIITDSFGIGQTQEGIVIDGQVGADPYVPIKGTIEDNQVERTGGGITVRGGSSVAIVNNRIEDIAVIAQPPAQGGIVYDISSDGLIASNTVERIEGGDGIYLGDTHGCKVYNNVVREASGNGIHIAGRSHDSLILENVVTLNGMDGCLVEGSRNFVDRNLLNVNCQSGIQACWGLHFAAGFGGVDNTFGRNTARGNLGVPPACPAGPGPYVPTTDFCDELPGSGSFNDNYMPNFF
jgi:parallel beta-helix repeat protein